MYIYVQFTSISNLCKFGKNANNVHFKISIKI